MSVLTNCPQFITDTEVNAKNADELTALIVATKGNYEEVVCFVCPALLSSCSLSDQIQIKFIQLCIS